MELELNHELQLKKYRTRTAKQRAQQRLEHKIGKNEARRACAVCVCSFFDVFEPFVEGESKERERAKSRYK